MSKFAARYTRAQKDACVKARALNPRRSYQDIARAAGAGELGTPRFEITPNYVGKLCRDNLHTFRPVELHDPQKAQASVDDARARILAWLLRDLEAFEKQARTGQTDLRHARLIMGALADWQRTSHKGTPGPQGDTQPEGQDNAQNVIAQLIAAANGTASNGAAEPTIPGSAAHAGSA